MTNINAILDELSVRARSDLNTIARCPGLHTGSYATGDLLVSLGLVETSYEGAAGFLGLSVAKLSPLGRLVLNVIED